MIFVDPLSAPDALRKRHDLSPKHGWCSGGPDRRGAAAARCLRTEMGGRVAGRESGPPADRGWFDGRRSRRGTSCGSDGGEVARRLEAHCLHGRPRRQQAQRLHSGDPGRHSTCRSRPKAWCSPARAAVRDDTSVLGRVGATWRLFPIPGGEGRPVPALKPGDIPLQWSQDGRYVYTVDNVGRGQVASR